MVSSVRVIAYRKHGIEMVTAFEFTGEGEIYERNFMSEESAMTYVQRNYPKLMDHIHIEHPTRSAFVQFRADLRKHQPISVICSYCGKPHHRLPADSFTMGENQVWFECSCGEINSVALDEEAA
jgi:hypothetical protein